MSLVLPFHPRHVQCASIEVIKRVKMLLRARETPRLSGALRAFGTVPTSEETRAGRSKSHGDAQLLALKRGRLLRNREDEKRWSDLCQEAVAKCGKQNAAKVKLDFIVELLLYSCDL